MAGQQAMLDQVDSGRERCSNAHMSRFDSDACTADKAYCRQLNSMSRSNIVKEEKLPGNRLRLTFQAADGERSYEFGPKTAAKYLKGMDPNQLRGKRVKAV